MKKYYLILAIVAALFVGQSPYSANAKPLNNSQPFFEFPKKIGSCETASDRINNLGQIYANKADEFEEFYLWEEYEEDNEECLEALEDLNNLHLRTYNLIDNYKNRGCPTELLAKEWFPDGIILYAADAVSACRSTNVGPHN